MRKDIPRQIENIVLYEDVNYLGIFIGVSWCIYIIQFMNVLIVDFAIYINYIYIYISIYHLNATHPLPPSGDSIKFSWQDTD